MIRTPETDTFFMHKALKQAQKAFEADEVPIGAVVVNEQGIVIGRGHNLVEKKHQQIAQAEIIAISQACKKIGDWRLEGCWLYVTLEPCAMCMNLIILSRLKGLVFGARSPIFGYNLDKEGLAQLYRRKTIEIVAGVCEQEAQRLLKQFFKIKREARERGKKNDGT